MSLINIDSLTFCYDVSYDNIFKNVSLQMDTDWKLGFTGRSAVADIAGTFPPGCAGRGAAAAV